MIISGTHDMPPVFQGIPWGSSTRKVTVARARCLDAVYDMQAARPLSSCNATS